LRSNEERKHLQTIKQSNCKLAPLVAGGWANNLLQNMIPTGMLAGPAGSWYKKENT